jgi:hypothetical protein
MFWVVPEDDTVSDCLEDLLLVDGEPILDVLVVLEHFVDVVRKCRSLRIQHGVVDCLSSLHY